MRLVKRLPHRSALGEHLLLIVEQLDVLGGRLRRCIVDEFAEEGLTILGELYHAGEHISELIGVASSAAALALNLHDEQPRVHLSEHAHVLYDLRTAHVRADLDLLADEVIQGVVDAIYDLCLLSEIHTSPLSFLDIAAV